MMFPRDSEPPIVDISVAKACIMDCGANSHLRAAFLKFVISAVLDKCAQDSGKEIEDSGHCFVSFLQKMCSEWAC